MKIRSERWAAVAAGVVFAFLVLEILLRVVGSQYQPLSARDASLRHGLIGSDKTVVLCVGDSVTYGIGATRGMEFPNQLEHRLNAAFEGDPFVVINSGIAGANSAMIRARLPEYLDATEPAVMVLLAGCANATNFFGYDSYMRPSTGWDRVMEFLFEIRSLRMIRFTGARLRQPERGDRYLILDGREASISAYLKWHESSEIEAGLSTHFFSGIDWLHLGRYEDARLEFEQGRLEDPEHSSNYWGLGVTHQGLRERDNAVEWFTECIRVNPLNPNGYFGAGEVYIEPGRERNLARRWFEDGVAADPSFSGNYYGLGMVAKTFGLPGSETEWFLRCIEADPDDARCYSNLIGRAQFDEDRSRQVEATLEKYAQTSQVARSYVHMLEGASDRHDINAWVRADFPLEPVPWTPA